MRIHFLLYDTPRGEQIVRIYHALHTAEPPVSRVNVPTAAGSCDSRPLLHSPEQEQAAHSTASDASKEHTPVPL